jgi:tetratricopeptide (TPR) repeat protein
MSLEGYTPIEQIKGKAVPQSDFFAIARTMVHLLTGISPYELPENEANGEVIWRDKVPAIPEAFADLLDEMMAVFPRERPQSTAEILQRLKAIAPFPKSRYPIPVQKPEFKPIKLRKFGLSIVALMAMAFPIALLFTSPQIAIACNKHGVNHHKNKELTPAELYYNCAIFLQRYYGKAHYNLGYLYEGQGKQNYAIHQYKIAIDYGIIAAYNNLARLLIFENQCEEAVFLLEKGLDLVKKDSVKYALLANLGRAKLCQNLHQEAKTYLGEAIALDSDRPQAYCLLAPVLDGLGDKKGAIEQLKKCPGDAPQNFTELDEWFFEKTRQTLLETP